MRCRLANEYFHVARLDEKNGEFTADENLENSYTTLTSDKSVSDSDWTENSWSYTLESSVFQSSGFAKRSPHL